MKRNRYKEIDEMAYEIFKFFKEKARENRYGEITATLTMHDGYPVKIAKGVGVPIKQAPIENESIPEETAELTDKSATSSEDKT